MPRSAEERLCLQKKNMKTLCKLNYIRYNCYLYISMCCFNAPYMILLSWILYGSYDDEITICHKICYDTLFYVLMPICIVLDIISLPFHIFNVMLRSCLHRPYSGYYFYDVICRTRPVAEPIEEYLGPTRPRSVSSEVSDFNSHMIP